MTRRHSRRCHRCGCHCRGGHCSRHRTRHSNGNWGFDRDGWLLLQEAGIGIPFPQRDVHLYLADDKVKTALATSAAPTALSRDNGGIHDDGGLDDGDDHDIGDEADSQSGGQS